MVTALVMIPCVALFLVARGFSTTEFFFAVLFLVLRDFLTDSTIMVFTSHHTVEFRRD